MENLLHSVIGVGMLSMLDRFLRYNQVQIRKEDRGKTTFTTPWGTYEYIRMPFGLLNAGSTFQRAMDQAFSDLIGILFQKMESKMTQNEFRLSMPFPLMIFCLSNLSLEKLILYDDSSRT